MNKRNQNMLIMSNYVCYMDTDSFIMHIKTKDFYDNITDDVEKI